jgi:hypothetical protein
MNKFAGWNYMMPQPLGSFGGHIGVGEHTTSDFTCKLFFVTDVLAALADEVTMVAPIPVIARTRTKLRIAKFFIVFLLGR